MGKLSWFAGVICVVGSLLSTGSLQAQSGPAKPLTKVTMRLDWKPGAQHAPFYLAKEKGYFSAEGLDVTIIAGSGSSDVVKQIGSNAINFGLVDALVLVQAAQQRVPVESIGAYYQRNPIVLISPQTKPIDDPKQLLKGVKVGAEKGSATFQALEAMLNANNMHLEQIKLVDVGFGVQPLLVGQVDALMGFAMNEPIEAESAGMKVHVMPISEHGVKSYGLTIDTNPNFLRDHKEIVQAFMRASQRGITAAIADPKAAIAALTKNVSELDAAREGQVLQQTIPYWTSADTQAHGLGWQSREVWQATTVMAKDVGLTDTVVDPDSLFTNDVVQHP